MKKVSIVAFGIILAGFFFAFSQTDSLHMKMKKTPAENDEYLHAMEVLDKNVLENAKALIHRLQTKETVFMQTAKFQCNEIGICLDTSDDYLTRLQKTTDIAMDEIQVAYYNGLHQHYRNAIKAHQALKAELLKPSPVNSIIKMNTFTIYGEITQADSERVEMQRKMDSKKPELQPVKKI
jgi:hypothetical protein